VAVLDTSLDALHPSAPATLEESGLSGDLVMQLLLKKLLFAGELSGTELANRVGLTFSVIDGPLEGLKRLRHCEIVGSAGFGGPSYRYRITDAGRTRAALFLGQNQYVGIAPVPLEQYRRYLERLRAAAPLKATRESVRAAFSHLVVRDALIDQIGPAVNSGHSMFLYGPPGNGKTVVAQAIRRLLAGDIAIPHALEVEGSIIRLFDPVNHEEIPTEDTGVLAGTTRHDRRWARCKRPLVIVGGELTLEALDLRFNATSGFYRAPVQAIANGGVLVIDDFGRQQCSPKELLNRWIVPLESRVDFLTLQTGQTFELPFMVFLIFATNLRPGELVDEAFLRRIQYKIYATSPSTEDFLRIFEDYCFSKDVPFEATLVERMLADFYGPRQIELRACHPRDLVSQALALAEYRGEPRRLTAELLDAACHSYFVEA
jgi:hypothetical protein